MDQPFRVGNLIADPNTSYLHVNVYTAGPTQSNFVAFDISGYNIRTSILSFHASQIPSFRNMNATED